MAAQDWKDLFMEGMKQGPWFCVLVALIVAIVLVARWIGRVAWPFVIESRAQFLAAHQQGLEKVEKAIQGGATQTEAMKIGFDGMITNLGGKLTTIDGSVSALHGKVDGLHQGVQSLLERRRSERTQEEK